MPRRWKIVSRFLRDEAGSYAVIVAVAMPAIIGAIGLAAEMGIWSWQKQQMQQIADSTAYTAATSSGAGETAAQAKAAGLAIAADTNPAATITLVMDSTTGAWTATATTVDTRSFSSIFGANTVTVSANATVQIGHTGDGCVLSLDPSSAGAFTQQGSTNVSLQDCSLYVDSNNASGALSMGGSATMTAKNVFSVGGIYGASSITADSIYSYPTPVSPLKDPMAGKYAYDVSSATPQKQPNNPPSCTVNGQTYTSCLYPGVYNTDISIKQNDNVYMYPGQYYLVDGAQLKVQGGGTLSGTGVSIILTKQNTTSYGSFKITGGNINLTAPTSGSTKGIVVLADPSMPNTSVVDLTGTNSSYWGGIVYAPSSTVYFTGGASSGSTGSCTKVVAYDVQMYGNSSLAIQCPDSVPVFGRPAVVMQ